MRSRAQNFRKGGRSGAVKALEAMWLAALILPAAAAAAIDDEIAARIGAINEVLERLEFDADRVNVPPAYQQAADAISSSICISASAQTDVDLTPLQFDFDFKGEAEAEAPPPVDTGVVLTFVEPSADYGAEASIGVDLNLSAGAFHRLCVDPLPWAMYAYYQGVAQLPGQRPFPEIVPDEVFIDDSGTGELPLDPGARDETSIARIADVEDDDPGSGLSADAIALLSEMGNQVFGGLEEVESGAGTGLGFIADHMTSLGDRLGVTAETIGAGTRNLAGAFNLDGLMPDEVGAVPSSIGQMFSAISEAPGQLSALIPFAPDIEWLGTNPLGIDSVEDLNLCASLGEYDTTGGDPLPYIHALFDEFCSTAGVAVEHAVAVIGDAGELIIDEVPAVAGELAGIVGRAETLKNILEDWANFMQSAYDELIDLRGSLANIKNKINDLADEMREFLD